MNYSDKILYGLFLSWTLGFITSRNLCINLLDDIGIVNVYYPEKYCKPSRLISKTYNLPKKVLPSVPKYIYVQMCITIVYPLFACAFVVLRLMFSISQSNAQSLLLFTEMAILMDFLCVFCVDFKWQRIKKAEVKGKR